MAQRGKTVLATIHQPNSQVFALFDRLLLMAEGRVAFFGGTDEAVTFFENRWEFKLIFWSNESIVIEINFY